MRPVPLDGRSETGLQSNKAWCSSSPQPSDVCPGLESFPARPPATFDPGILMMAMVVHLALSVLFALVLALMIARLGFGAALAVGAAFGLGLYLINFYGMTASSRGSPWRATG